MKAYCDASPTKLAVVCEDGRELVRDATRPHTNNEAEYFAVLAAVKAFPEVTEVLTDSQLVVRQLIGEYRVRKPELLALCLEVLKATNGRVKFTWVPREENLAGKLLE